MSRPAAFALTLLLAACGAIDYDAQRPGTFDGSVLVMWVGEGDRLGDGEFVYVPSPGDPLRFTRPDGTVLAPEIMYTDGGSIPKVAQLFNGFSPWGYAPAYMIHDWVFVARHCRTDGTPTEAEAALADMTFQDTAEIAAEAIKALIADGRVAPNDVAPRVISGTVAGPFSYERWAVRGACVEDRPTEEHLAQVEAALAPPTILRRGPEEPIIIGPPAAQIITQIDF